MRKRRAPLMMPTIGLFLLLSAAVSSAQAPTDVVRGWEFAAAVNLVPKDVKAEATIFIPQSASRVRAVLVVIKYGLGFQVTTLPSVLKLAEGLDAAILGVQFSNVSPNV